MTHDDAELVQLRLIDDFLEEEGDYPVADDGFDEEVECAIIAVENSRLRDIHLAIDLRSSDEWVVSLRHARLRARKPVTS